MTQRSLVMVSPYDMTIPGGVQGQISGLTRQLVMRNWSVTVAAPGARPSELAPAVEFESLGRTVRFRANGSVAPLTLDIRRARQVAQRCVERGVDVVHLHEPLAPVAGWPFMDAHHQALVGTFHRSGVDALARAAGSVLRKRIKRIDVPVAVSAAAAETARQTVGISPTVLFNGVELSDTTSVEAWPTTGPTVLFLGRDEPRKGRSVLLEAAQRLPASTTVWVTGDRPRAFYPRSGANVEFLGQISDGEKARRLAAVDVLCAPSLGGESFGLVLLEGLANGVTVVASDIDGYRQALGGHGHLVPPNNPQLLAEALTKALDDAPNHGDKEIDAYLERWSMATLADSYEEIYDRACSSRLPRTPE